jgi:hypothetical protein
MFVGKPEPALVANVTNGVATVRIIVRLDMCRLLTLCFLKSEGKYHIAKTHIWYFPLSDTLSMSCTYFQMDRTYILNIS